MELIRPSYEILTKVDGNEVMKQIELAARTCYKSEAKITAGSAREMVHRLIKSGHEAMIEHSPAISVKFIVDRGVSHELVRHRMASFAQESTRYCDYSGDIEFVIPPWIDIEPRKYEPHELPLSVDSPDYTWYYIMRVAESSYNALRSEGWSPQQARSVLPNSLKTEIIVTANLREWRHIFKLRAIGTTGRPHPQMAEIMVPLCVAMCEILPEVFDDLFRELLVKDLAIKQ